MRPAKLAGIGLEQAMLPAIPDSRHCPPEWPARAAAAANFPYNPLSIRM
jgi:hypothetical protein